jgi:hypothetical protein
MVYEYNVQEFQDLRLTVNGKIMRRQKLYELGHGNKGKI